MVHFLLRVSKGITKNDLANFIKNVINLGPYFDYLNEIINAFWKCYIDTKSIDVAIRK